MSSNIKVVVRVRPINFKELAGNARAIVNCLSDKILALEDSNKNNKQKLLSKELTFAFDGVCGPTSTNREVFEITVKDILNYMTEGYNCSVFVCGATGAGKTYTMVGTQDHPGLMFLTIKQLFNTINSFEHGIVKEISVSYVEVYNENVYDLLKHTKKPLVLRDNDRNGVTVVGLTKFTVKTAQELLQMLENGNRNRTQHPTDNNAESSRSHAVFQVYLKMHYKTSNQLRTVKLSMIDLAGSERASASGVRDRCKEGANINLGLLSLGNCINKLAAGSSFVPYRDSKLTRLLKDSLGGNSKTVMIANISPSNISYEDTYNTLKYAAQAKKIRVSIKKNIANDNKRLSQVVEEYKQKVNELEAKLTLSSSNAVTDVFKEKVKQEWHRRLLQKDQMHSSLEKQLLSLMSRQRVLALRQRLRTRAFLHIAELAHRSFTEAMEQMCAEDTPCQESESYMKQSDHLDSEVMCAWTKWDESRKKFSAFCERAIVYCPELSETVKTMKLQREIRHIRARDDLRLELLSIEHFEINMFTELMSEMPSMFKKLFLTLKDYGEVPSALTTEFLNIMKKAKTVQGTSWSDEANAHLKFISNLDIDQPSSNKEYGIIKKVDGNDDIVTASDNLNKEENREPIRESTKNNSANQIMSKLELDKHVENFKILDPINLNSKFELAGKIAPFKKPNMEARKIGTNTVNSNKAKTFKPVVNKAFPFRQPATASRPGFGSSLSQDGRTPFQPYMQGASSRSADALANVLGNTKEFCNLPTSAPTYRVHEVCVPDQLTESSQKQTSLKLVDNKRKKWRVRMHPYLQPPALSTRK